MTGRRYTVLVLEDDPTQGRLYRKILSSGPFEASLLSDPMSLLEGLETIPVPDVMLLDVMLPSMDGICVLEQLESHPRWCGVPAVMMTASPTPARIRAARRLPVPPEGFLAKPVNPEAMRSLLLAVIESSDPAHLKQRLQRQKRATQIGICSDYEQIQRSFQEACNVGRELAGRINRNRREAQRLRIMQSKLTDAPAETQRSIGDLLQALDQERERHQADAQRSEELRIRILETKKGIRRKQRQINEIDHQLHILSGYPGVSAGQGSDQSRPLGEEQGDPAQSPEEPPEHYAPPAEDMILLSAVGDVLDSDCVEEADGPPDDPAAMSAGSDPGLCDDDPAGLDATGSD